MRNGARYGRRSFTCRAGGVGAERALTVRFRLAFIINPFAGSSARRNRPADLVDAIRRRCAAAAADHEVAFTERPGHGRELAAALAGRGFSPVVAWGGDGTVNEVASALMHRDAALGIVPAGSGNGLARELGISLRPEEAIETAVRGRDRVIDVGELDGRPFVNLAGVGLPASVADLFARLARPSSPDGSAWRPTEPAGARAVPRRLTGRGLAGYVLATARQLARYRSQRYTLVTEGRSVERPALLIEVANGRQYGNGAVIAPRARLDDGLLDLVSVDPISRARAAWGLWRLFNGTVDRHRYVHCSRVAGVTISADRPLRFHVDGEAVQGGCTLSATIHPKALRVRVPAAAGG